MITSRQIFYIILLILFFEKNLFSQGNWVQKAVLPAGGRLTAVAFTIGNKGYLGTGVGANIYDDFWEYDPVNDLWAQMANFGGGPVSYATGFSIGTKGYIGTGTTSSGFWEYDPSNNSWTQKSFTLTNRYEACGFSVNGKGYIGTGSSGVPDIWEYDPVNDSWIQKGNFPGGNRTDIDRAVFVICNKAYWGTGISAASNYSTDFWEYDPITDTWTQKVNFPAAGRFGATGFSISNHGYIGLGEGQNGLLNDFWSYDPFLNSWSAVSPFPGPSRADAPSFVINNKAYIGTGTGGGGNFYNDFWEFTDTSLIATPCSEVFVRETDFSNSISIFPNPANDELFIRAGNTFSGNATTKIYDSEGRLVLSKSFLLTPSISQTEIDISSVDKGFYLMEINAGGKNYFLKFVKE